MIKAVVLACAVALALFVFAAPEWNFDVVCYAGAARTWLRETPEQAHANVYRDLAAAAPADAVEAITSLSEYRQGVANSVEQFMIQLPLYTVGPLYVLPVATAVNVGANSIAVPFWISAIAYGCFAVLLLSAFIRVAPIGLALAIGLALLLSPRYAMNSFWSAHVGAARRTWSSYSTPCRALSAQHFRSYAKPGGRRAGFSGRRADANRAVGARAWPRIKTSGEPGRGL